MFSYFIFWIYIFEVEIFFHILSMRPLSIREPSPRPGGTGGPSAGFACSVIVSV